MPAFLHPQAEDVPGQPRQQRQQLVRLTPASSPPAQKAQARARGLSKCRGRRQAPGPPARPQSRPHLRPAAPPRRPPLNRRDHSAAAPDAAPARPRERQQRLRASTPCRRADTPQQVCLLRTPLESSAAETRPGGCQREQHSGSGRGEYVGRPTARPSLQPCPPVGPALRPRLASVPCKGRPRWTYDAHTL